MGCFVYRHIQVLRNRTRPVFFRHNTHRYIQTARPRLYRLACSWTHNSAQADDLTQETLLRAVERLHQLRDTSALDAWLTQIMLNCWRDQLRASRDMLDVDEFAETIAAPAPAFEDDLSAAQEARAVRAAIARLPVAQREVLTLIDLGECSYAQAAALLNVPTGTIMSRIARARSALAALLLNDPVRTDLRPHMRRVK